MNLILLQAGPLSGILENAGSTLADVGLKIIGAIILWVVGRWLIKFAIGLVSNSSVVHSQEENRVWCDRLTQAGTYLFCLANNFLKTSAAVSPCCKQS